MTCSWAPFKRVQRGAVLVMTGAAVSGLLAGCSLGTPHRSIATPASATGAPVTARAQFRPTWLPLGLQPTDVHARPQYVDWTGPRGTSGRVLAEGFVYAGDSGHPHLTLSLTAVSARAYPAGFWPTFANSPAYRHVQVGTASVALASRTSSGSASAVVLDRGYVLQLTGVGVAADDLVHVVRGLRWN